MDKCIGLDAPGVKLHARGARAERETTRVGRVDMTDPTARPVLGAFFEPQLSP